MSASLLLPGYLALVVFPIVLGWLRVGPDRVWTDEFSSALAMAGFAALLLEFLLSGRFRAISAAIGIDRTMRWHQACARLLTAALLVHPFLYTTPLGPEFRVPGDAAQATALTTDTMCLTSGWFAWGLLGLLAVVAAGRDLLPWRDPTWRLLHGVTAAAIALLGVLHALRTGHYSSDPVIAAYWVAMTGLALSSLAGIYLLRPLRLSRRPWRVASLRPAAERCWEVVLEPQGHAGLLFRAGQFAWVRLGHSPFSLHEQMVALAAAPGPGGRLSLLVREEADGADWPGSLPIGARAHVDGPHGNLVVEGRDEPGICLIGEGMGVAPLLAILGAGGAGRPARLICGNRHAGQILGRAQIEASGVAVLHVLQVPPVGWTGATGVIDRGLIEAECAAEARAGWLFVACGPPPMLQEVRAGLAVLGVPASRILEEARARE